MLDRSLDEPTTTLKAGGMTPSKKKVILCLKLPPIVLWRYPWHLVWPDLDHHLQGTVPQKTIDLDATGNLKKLSLHESGLLSEMEYQSEWEAIMTTLKNLLCSNHL